MGFLAKALALLVADMSFYMIVFGPISPQTFGVMFLFGRRTHVVSELQCLFAFHGISFL